MVEKIPQTTTPTNNNPKNTTPTYCTLMSHPTALEWGEGDPNTNSALKTEGSYPEGSMLALTAAQTCRVGKPQVLLFQLQIAPQRQVFHIPLPAVRWPQPMALL